MFGYIMRRLIGVVGLLIALSFVTFALFTVAPANPALLVCGKSCNAASLAAQEERMGLDQPFLVQYTRYMVGIPCGESYPPVGGAFTCLRFHPELQGLNGAVYCPPEPVALGYSFISGIPDGTGAQGLVIGLHAGSLLDLAPALFLEAEVGYQAGFQRDVHSLTESDARTSFVQIGAGVGVRI